MSDDLTTLTVEWLSALLDSASVDIIGATHWWDRAASALETAAAGADSAAQATTIACRKLQIDVLSEQSSATVADIAARLDTRWGEWVEKIAAESIYLVALCRVQRAERRARREPKQDTSEAIPF